MEESEDKRDRDDSLGECDESIQSLTSDEQLPHGTTYSPDEQVHTFREIEGGIEEVNDDLDNVFSEPMRHGITDEDLVRLSCTRRPPPVKAASTISRRNINRPLPQKSLRFANHPASAEDMPIKRGDGSVQSPAEPSPTPSTSSAPKMPSYIRPKILRSRTKTGNIVLPHKFRKSRRDQDRLNSIYMSSIDSTRSNANKDTKVSATSWFISCLPFHQKRQLAPDEFDAEAIRAKELYLEEDPLRKRCLRAFLNGIYVVMVIIAAVVTYSMVQDLINSMRNPVRSIRYNKVESYNAPGIAVYPGGAYFKACGHYYNNVVTSKIHLDQLDLVNLSCSYSDISYTDPHHPNVTLEALVIRGPTSFVKREAIFLHFEMEDITRHFYTVSYFVFPNYDKFNVSLRQGEELVDYHRYRPTFALSAGFRMWIKLIMSESSDMSGGERTDFKVEYSIVKFRDRRPKGEQKRHLFFIFFEWKNDIIEESSLIYTTTPWSIGAGLCGVFLTLHKGCQLAQTSYKRVQKDKQKRSIRKRTLRELRQMSQSRSQNGSTD